MGFQLYETFPGSVRHRNSGSTGLSVIQVATKGFLSQSGGQAGFIAKEIQVSAMRSHAVDWKMNDALHCPIFRQYFQDLRDNIRQISQFVCRT